jgi:hypothetical protein
VCIEQYSLNHQNYNTLQLLSVIKEIHKLVTAVYINDIAWLLCEIKSTLQWKTNKLQCNKIIRQKKK